MIRPCIVLVALIGCRQSPKTVDTGLAETMPPAATTPSIPTFETGTLLIDSGPTVDTGITIVPRDCTAPEPVPVDPDPACPDGVAALVGDTTYASVADAVAAAVSGDTVEVCPGTWPATVTFTADITLRGRAGREATVLDGGGAGRVLTAADLIRVEVVDLTIACGETSDWGGGVYGEVALARVRLVDNHAAVGGGFYGWGGFPNGVIGPDVVFERNRADVGGGAAFWGFDLVDVTFQDNEAVYCGAFDVDTDTVIRRTTVTRNRAEQDGGGACIEGPYRSNVAAIVVDSSFSENSAGDDGGGVWSRDDGTGSYVHFHRVSFVGNVADAGGGLYATQPAYGHPIRISDSEFTGNQARLGGGVAGGVTQIWGSSLTENVATEAGGALYLDGETLLIDTRIISNEALVGGGVAIGSAHAVWVTELLADFGADGAENIGGDLGLVDVGIVYPDLGAEEIAICAAGECTFAPSAPAAARSSTSAPPKRSATVSAGCGTGIAALLDGVGYLSVGDAVAVAAPGATISVCPGDWPADLDITTDLVITGLGGSTVALLSGEDAHRVLTVQEGATLTLSGVGVHRGVDTVGGGGILVLGSMDAVDVDVMDCTAPYGGGVRIGGVVTWTGGSFARNQADAGGAISVDAGSLDVRSTAFDDNWAMWSGGALATLDPSARVALTDVTATGNAAGAYGGVVVDWSGSLVVDGLRCESNRARRGGCLDLGGGSISELVATGNGAGEEGGAVYGTADLYASTLAQNRAYRGGGAYLLSGSTVRESTVSENAALTAGGLSLESVTIEATSITGNRALTAGGLYVWGATTLTESSVTDNVAGEAGGAYLTAGATLSSAQTDWGVDSTDNTPDDVGGAVPSGSYGDAADFTCDGATATCT